MSSSEEGGPDVRELEKIIVTAELERRPSREPDLAAENQALIQLTKELARSPQDFFQSLVETSLKLCRAQSAGISLMDDGAERFYWPAIAGALAPYVGGGTPRHFGPCGVVCDRNTFLMMTHPERYYDYLMPLRPVIEELLLVPFHIQEKPVGTLWAVQHDTSRTFDREDKRLMESLCAFASASYRVLTDMGMIKLAEKKKS